MRTGAVLSHCRDIKQQRNSERVFFQFVRVKRNRNAGKGRAEIRSTTQNTKFVFAPFLKRGGKGDW